MSSKIIINTLVAAGLALMVWLVTIPVWTEISELRKEVSLKKKSIELERQVIEKLNAINQVLDSQKSNVERLEQAIPSSEFKPEMISIMENLASQNGLNLSKIDVKSAMDDTSARTPGSRPVISSGKEMTKTLTVDVNSSGNYNSFKSWLGAVEKSLRLMDVTKISFDVTQSKTAEGEIIPGVDPIIDYSVSMKTYVLKK
ncbi:MAG: type 4a pilus biogenesis protein PilO [Candidatus Sungbacteria bacterium]|uniref:Type 4a pilus biogenesis protein PilO n=1 Tax=Candidatus Sungiibacteriota bacterium TaxID=2750080 RepID=A0A932DSC6_9BACT|nr:type 4a pilus biogenesis protein PilO [Candidatus Sungbacteria bacterium]MBI2466126.1 type 4a pilus biogenesis protein PilO [Candidatus Sungbacteria bacterium]